MALDWDILNEDCSDISDWTNYDDAGCSSTQVTFDGKDCFFFNTPETALNNTSAERFIAVLIPTTCTVEWSFYIGAVNGAYFNRVSFRTNSGSSPYEYYRLGFIAGNGVTQAQFTLTKNTALAGIWAPVGDITDLLGTWHTVRMVIKADRKVDVWLDNRVVFANEVVTATSILATGVNIWATSDNTSPNNFYMDDFKIDTTPEAPTNVSQIQIYDQQIATRFRGWTSSFTGWQPLSKVRFQGTYLLGYADGVCEIPLVATDDVNASKVRIYDGTDVKSLMKLPS